MHTESRTVSRRSLLAAASGALLAASLRGNPANAQQSTPVATPLAAARDWQGERWVGTWAAAPATPFPPSEEFQTKEITLNNQTVRQIVHTSIGGDQVRVRLTNLFGEQPLQIGAAHIALRDADDAIVPDSDRVLTFSGLPSIAIPAGALVLSDPVSLDVPAQGDLAISLYFPDALTASTAHAFSSQTNYISQGGNASAATVFPTAEEMQSWIYLAGVDVQAAEPTTAIVTLGDSITDGFGSTPDTNQRWPDQLANRLVADASLPPMGVLNMGIGGNRLLHNSGGVFAGGFGESALTRLDRDVLAQPNVSHLIVFEGINDIGLPNFGSPDEGVSAQEMIGALRQIVERVHERGILVYGATLTPFEGAVYFTPEGEAMRQEVNAWIRDSGAFDAVLDFDAVVQDPAQPSKLLAAYDSGDALHINDAGYAAMAESIDLALFAPTT